VLLEVVEGVLRGLGEAHVGVLGDVALGRRQLPDQQLDGRGLARAVGANHQGRVLIMGS